MLEIRDLAKRFGDVVALDGTTFDAQPGRIVGFLGPNGAGKTTTMRVIFGLVRPDRGEVRWRGRPVGPPERCHFGYMPEERGLYPKMKVGEQLSYFAELAGLSPNEARAATVRWLERLGLADRSGARVEQLSHGNQQRVQLAAALVHDPELVVLDEPFSGLDPIGVELLAEMLSRTAEEGVTVLFSSHQLDLVEDVCQDVVIIDHGTVVLAGEVEGLRSASSRRSLQVSVDGEPWVPTFAEGARMDGDRMLVDASVDLAAMLASAGAAGEVTRFSFDPPTLTDLFRDAVSRGHGG